MEEEDDDFYGGRASDIQDADLIGDVTEDVKDERMEDEDEHEDEDSDDVWIYLTLLARAYVDMLYVGRAIYTGQAGRCEDR